MSSTAIHLQRQFIDGENSLTATIHRHDNSTKDNSSTAIIYRTTLNRQFEKSIFPNFTYRYRARFYDIRKTSENIRKFGEMFGKLKKMFGKLRKMFEKLKKMFV